jgi:DNA-binding MarR family transcriptional regulator
MAEISHRVNPLFLREEELRQGMELMLFAYRDVMAAADRTLAEHGLGRAHHRAVYFIGRHPGLSVSDLMAMLGITKQSLSRVVKELESAGFVETREAPNDRRRRLLTLTQAGETLERALTDAQRRRFAHAYREAGAAAVEGFRQVLLALTADEHRKLLAESGPPAP